jgi:hypothetical protein
MLKNFKPCTDWRKLNGTSLIGCVNVSYSTLVDMFGPPHSDGDGHKVDAEWDLQHVDGTVITIYNYKDGKNYCGSNGDAVEDITYWHVGGKENKALRLIDSCVNSYAG